VVFSERLDASRRRLNDKNMYKFIEMFEMPLAVKIDSYITETVEGVGPKRFSFFHKILS
jgi:hypothetical protein